MSSNPGKKWPWIIVLSILGVVGLGYWTIDTAMDNPVELSDLDMQDYQHFEYDANSIIKSKIEFDKKYTAEYVTTRFDTAGATIKFKVTTVDHLPVNDANVTIRVTRPNTHVYDRKLSAPKVENGVYTFETITLPKPGRWDVIARIQIGENVRYINMKADTRYPNAFEY